MTLLAWGVAWLLDFIIGDPQSWPHPVRWIGNLIAAVQRGVRRYCHSDVAGGGRADVGRLLGRADPGAGGPSVAWLAG